jgi:ketosteroid isomerase-like protein
MSSRYRWFLATMMLFPMGVIGTNNPTLSNQQQEVMKVSDAWRDAFNHRDLETFAHYVADDFIASTDEGDLLTKTAFIQYLSTRPPKDVQKTDAHDFQIHVDGDAAIVNYLVTSLNTWGDTTLVFHRRRTEFFKKTDGMWLALAAHESPVPVNFRKPTKASPKTFQDYVGEYDWPRHAARDIDKYTVEGGRLMSEWRGTKRECFPMGKDTFFARDDIGLWTFVRDEQGRVTGYIYQYPDGQEIRTKKIK